MLRRLPRGERVVPLKKIGWRGVAPDSFLVRLVPLAFSDSIVHARTVC